MAYLQNEIALNYYEGLYCGLEVIFSPDGEYINATKLADKYRVESGKRKDVGNYLGNKTTIDLIKAFVDRNKKSGSGIPDPDDFHYEVKNSDLGDNGLDDATIGRLQGKYIHTDIAVNYGQWLSPHYGVLIADIIKSYYAEKYESIIKKQKRRILRKNATIQEQKQTIEEKMSAIDELKDLIKRQDEKLNKMDRKLDEMNNKLDNVLGYMNKYCSNEVLDTSDRQCLFIYHMDTENPYISVCKRSSISSSKSKCCTIRGCSGDCGKHKTYWLPNCRGIWDKIKNEFAIEEEKRMLTFPEGMTIEQFSEALMKICSYRKSIK